MTDDAFGPTTTTVKTGATATYTDQGADEHIISANDLSLDSGDRRAPDMGPALDVLATTPPE